MEALKVAALLCCLTALANGYQFDAASSPRAAQRRLLQMTSRDANATQVVDMMKQLEALFQMYASELGLGDLNLALPASFKQAFTDIMDGNGTDDKYTQCYVDTLRIFTSVSMNVFDWPQQSKFHKVLCKIGFKLILRMYM